MDGFVILWISVFNYPCFYGYSFVYPWISMDIHALTCYGFSIQGHYLFNLGQFTISSPFETFFVFVLLSTHYF